MAPPTNNERNFKCHLCDKAYTAQANLCTHYRNAHPGRETLADVTRSLREKVEKQLDLIKSLLMDGYTLSINQEIKQIDITTT